MAIMFEPKGNDFTPNTNDLPLGQKPEGDEFDKALLKLENVIHTLNSKMKCT